MLKNIGFKPLFLLFLSAIIVVSFLVLKLKDFSSPEEGFDVVDVIDLRLISNSVFHENNSGLISGFSSYDDFFSFIEKNKSDKGSYFEYSGSALGNFLALGQEHLYALIGGDLMLIDTQSLAGPELAYTLELEDKPVSILFDKDVLLLFQESDSRIILTFFDASDPYSLIEFKKFEMDGHYFGSSLIDGYLYFIVNNYNEAFPSVFYRGEELHFNCRDGLRCLYPDIYYFDTDYSDGFNFSSVVSISLLDKSDDIRFSSYLMPGSEKIYFFSENIYISYTKRFNERLLESQVLLELIYPRLTEKDRGIIEEVYNISDEILGTENKRLKIRQILDSYMSFLSPLDRRSLWLEVGSIIKEREPELKERASFSLICRLALFDGIVEPVAEGIVLGEVLDLKAYDKNLKVLALQDPSFLNYALDSEKSLNFYVTDDSIQGLDEIRSLSSSGKDYVLDLNDNGSLSLLLSPDEALFLIDSENPFNISFLAKWGDLDYDMIRHLYIDNYLFLLGFKDGSLELFYWDTSAGSFNNMGFYAFEEFEFSSNVFPSDPGLFWLGEHKTLLLALGFPDGFNRLVFLNLEGEEIEVNRIIDLRAEDVFRFQEYLYYIPDKSLWFSPKEGILIF
jgi:uncharacterized secreted protein with C-terminal beta-propeller domain